MESFNGKLVDELLEREVFYTLHEAKVLIEHWRILYNTIRPHSALGYRRTESHIQELIEHLIPRRRLQMTKGGGLPARRLSIRLTDLCGQIFPGYLGASTGRPPMASIIVRRPYRTAVGNSDQASITR